MVSNIKLENKIENLFYLRKGLRYYKLTLRTKMKFMIFLNLEKKAKRVHLSKDENDMLYIVTYGFERIDLNALDPFVCWINDSKEKYVM